MLQTLTTGGVGTDWINSQAVPSVPVARRSNTPILTMEALGLRSYSGSLSPTELEQIPAVWRAIDIISGTLATCPLIIEERVERDVWREVEFHPIRTVWHEAANDLMDAHTAKRLMARWALTHTESYTLLRFDGRGRLVGMIPMKPDRVFDDAYDPKNFVLYVFEGNEVARRIPRGQILHIRWMASDMGKAKSISQIFRRSLGVAKLQAEYLSGFYERGAVPGGIMYHPRSLSNNAKSEIRLEWESAHGGIDNAHRIAILDDGIKYEAVKSSHAEQDLRQLMQFSVSDAARIYGMPLHMLAVADATKFATAEQAAREFLLFTMRPHFASWVSAIRFSCLSKFERDKYRIRFDEASLVYGTFAEMVEAVTKATDKGLLDTNEGRKIIGYSRRDGADELMKQKQNVPIGATNAA